MADAQQPTTPPSVASIIEAEGVFALSDGSSTFRLHRGGTFVMEPVGISGQTVKGVWKLTDLGHFVIVGKWGWVNGLSMPNDYRRMKLYISYHGGEPKALPRGSIKAHPCYFLIQEMVKVDKATYDAAMR